MSSIPVWSDPIPDIVGTIIAARAWCYFDGRLFPIFSGAMGAAPFGMWGQMDELYRSGQNWGTRDVQEARCRRQWKNMAGSVLLDHGESGPPPAKGCTCGFWGLNSTERLVSVLHLNSMFSGRSTKLPLEGKLRLLHRRRREAFVLGTIEMWGKVIPGDWGWRSQYARVAGILSNSHPSTRRIARDYRVPTFATWPELTPPHMEVA